MLKTNYKRLPERGIATLKIIVFLFALVPLGKLIVLGVMDDLGANPIEKILKRTGFWTLTFLSITLAVTSLRLLSGAVWLGRFRRMLGLFTFFYACLHFLTYLVLDQFFDWAAILKDIGKRPFITIGFLAFLLLIPLAITSTDRMIRRLGGENWRKLHRLAYVICLAGVVHFWWLVKKDITEPLVFAVILAVSLLIRLLFRFKAH